MKRLIFLLAVIGAVGCAPEPTVLPPEAFVTPTEPVIPTVTPNPTPTETPIPTEIPRDFILYQDPSGVFALTIPEDWEAIPTSTDRQLQVRFLPPPGFGSRVRVEITNEGLLDEDAVRGLTESVIAVTYDDAYTEVSRETRQDGAQQVVFLYDDGQGGRGRERLITQQAGPYFVVMRVFLAERDSFLLTNALNTVANGLTVNRQVVWGGGVAAVNPAELVPINTLLWQDEDGLTYYMGEIRNDAPIAVTDPVISVALCNAADVVLAEVSSPTAITQVAQGRTAPFNLIVEGLPEDVNVCSQSANAQPTQPDPSVTSALEVETSVDTDPEDGELAITGTITNPTLSPVTGVRVIVALYSAEGAVAGYTLINLGPDVALQPGASTGFRALFERLGAPAERFVVFTEGTVLRSPDPSLAP